jgi:hypothetical protein
MRTRPHSRLELRVRVRPDDVPIPCVHSGESLHGFDGLLKREDVKVGGEVCRIDNVCCEGARAGLRNLGGIDLVNSTRPMKKN